MARAAQGYGASQRARSRCMALIMSAAAASSATPRTSTGATSAVPTACAVSAGRGDERALIAGGLVGQLAGREAGGDGEGPLGRLGDGAQRLALDSAAGEERGDKDK